MLLQHMGEFYGEGICAGRLDLYIESKLTPQSDNENSSLHGLNLNLQKSIKRSALVCLFPVI
jgi:hypothetical protein